MQIGELDQRILFQSLVETNTSGSLVQAWSQDSPPDEVFAKVITEKGSESFESARINARAMVRVCVRYRADVDEAWRMTWQGQIYYIKTVDRSERRKGWLWFTAECNGAG